MPEVWRLLSGKMSRPNKDGVMELHRAPYDFEPTPGELAANKFRMVKLNDGAASTSTATSTENVPSFLLKYDDIRTIELKEAVTYIGTVVSEETLDKLLKQEIDNKPKVRRKIIEAIEQRRLALKAPSSDKFALSQIAASESAE